MTWITKKLMDVAIYFINRKHQCCKACDWEPEENQ